MLRALPAECGLLEPEQPVLALLQQMSKMKAALDLAVISHTGANIVTQVCVCVLGAMRDSGSS